jgi:hypothetical protein
VLAGPGLLAVARALAGSLARARVWIALVRHVAGFPVLRRGFTARGIVIGCVVWQRLADQPVTHAALALASQRSLAPPGLVARQPAG